MYSYTYRYSIGKQSVPDLGVANVRDLPQNKRGRVLYPTSDVPTRRRRAGVSVCQLCLAETHDTRHASSILHSLQQATLLVRAHYVDSHSIISMTRTLRREQAVTIQRRHYSS